MGVTVAQARDAALARALKVEEEVATATEDHAAALSLPSVVARLLRAPPRNARLLLLPLMPQDPLGPPLEVDWCQPLISLQHEAVALLQLHAQAVAVNNIQNHVTIVLDVSSTFNCWHNQFMLILGKFSAGPSLRGTSNPSLS